MTPPAGYSEATAHLLRTEKGTDPAEIRSYVSGLSPELVGELCYSVLLGHCLRNGKGDPGRAQVWLHVPSLDARIDLLVERRDELRACIYAAEHGGRRLPEEELELQETLDSLFGDVFAAAPNRPSNLTNPTYELVEGNQSHGTFSGIVPRAGDSITLGKSSSGYLVRVTGVDHFCDLETHETSTRGSS